MSKISLARDIGNRNALDPMKDRHLWSTPLVSQDQMNHSSQTARTLMGTSTRILRNATMHGVEVNIATIII